MTLSLIAFLAVLETSTCASALAAGDHDQLWLALASGGFGLLLILLVVSALREAMAMKRWPVAKGRIVSSTVEQYKEIAGAGKFGGTRTRMTLYRPAIVYEYEAAGQHFKGNRIAQSPGMNRGIADFAEQTVQHYPPGSAVDVYFNPARPGEAVLETRVPGAWIAVLVIAIALLVLAVYIYYDA